MVLKKVGKRIQELRKKKGLTQEQLSEMIDLSTHYLSSLERGVFNIKIDKLVRIMNILECSADDIFCDVIDCGYKVQSSRLSEEISQLPKTEQTKIFAVVETMIEKTKV